LENYVDALNISVASFGFVLTLFPVYSSMKKAKRRLFRVSLVLALTIVFVLYLALSFSSILYFGALNVKPSIFENFSLATDWQSQMILFMFLVVLLCNAPFPFFAGKTALVAGILIIATLQS